MLDGKKVGGAAAPPAPPRIIHPKSSRKIHSNNFLTNLEKILTAEPWTLEWSKQRITIPVTGLPLNAMIFSFIVFEKRAL